MTKLLLKLFVISFFLFLFSLFSPQSVLAIKYDLTAPSGTLSRGQNADFTISVDTEGQALTNAVIGMTYKSDVLQYVSTTPGNTFTTVSTDTSTPGQLIFTASSSSGFTGTGTYATVTFKIIATTSGSTELCVLFNPTPTPQQSTVQPTTVVPTRLPRSGSTDNISFGAITGLGFILLAGVGLTIINKKSVKTARHQKK